MMLNPMHPFHKGRPVDARWVWICELARQGYQRVWDDDEWIRRGLAYVRRQQGCRRPADVENLEKDFADIKAADRLRAANDKMERAIVEARLLAGQTVEEVADACTMPVTTIIAYEKLFFQVLGRLGAPLFVMSKAIGIHPFEKAPREEDTDILLKLFAYQKGPLFLEITLRYFRHGVRVPERLDAASAADLDELALMLRMRAAVLARVLPYTKCQRARIWSNLADEVKAYAASRMVPDVASIVSQTLDLSAPNTQPKRAAEMPLDECATPAWWSMLQEALRAA